MGFSGVFLFTIANRFGGGRRRFLCETLLTELTHAGLIDYQAGPVLSTTIRTCQYHANSKLQSVNNLLIVNNLEMFYEIDK